MIGTRTVPVIGFAAYSGTGKTTLLARIIPMLVSDGLRIGVVKHSHHNFEIDKPGKDSHVLRTAGANTVMLSSSRRRAIISEWAEPHEPVLADELRHLDRSELDLILVEGFRHEHFPKIELHRPSLGHPLLFPGDDSIVAIATDLPLSPEPPIPGLDLNRPELIAGFVKTLAATGTGRA